MERENEAGKIAAGGSKWVADHERPLLRLGAAAGLVIAGAAVASIALVSVMKPASTLPTSPPDSDAVEVSASFTPPDEATIPDGPEGDAIRRGKAIFDDPRTHAAPFVGNAMACKNCHLDSGRKPDSSPMWAAWTAYPQYRKKNNSINTMEDRILGCFRYSMNAPNSSSGGPPPPGHDIYRDLEAYFHWLATGARTGVKLKGANYPKPALAEGGYDPKRGAAIYEQKCSACHGSDGAGARQPDGSVTYPPLWGPSSYNWGAGMARIDLAAGFIRANMPFTEPGSLSDQEAWDVAAFIDSHERPKDPRQTGTVAANAAANFKDQKSYYGQTVDGKLLGTGVSPAR
ncbi:c-type cytochrome [Sphingomonas jaspsi]|uniref:c-type cytochrome n=1 Tax=Sphingomonas jaspsi TaxID=392409 RepID=UPI0004B4C220|nr:c-type cytochrome [Sphingomonas jaspsi]